MKSPTEILQATKCGDIFEINNIDIIKSEYRELIKKYHPDVYKEENANEIIIKLNSFYDKALDLISKGLWEATNIIYISSIKGTQYKSKFLSQNFFELGVFYIGKGHIVYLLNDKKYYDNMLKQLSKIKYANNEMEKEFKRYIPDIINHFETIDHKWCIVLKKTEDTFLLKDLLIQQNNKLDPKHVAWIISRLSNITCFLKYNKIVHNGISLNNCYISPSFHTILLLGGWWYATSENEKMLGTQREIFDIMSLKSKQEKISEYQTDLESIKLIGKQLLNDYSLIVKKGEISNIPDPFRAWLQKGSSNDAFNEYESWTKALDKSWGERKFIKLEVIEEDIYKNL